MSATISFESPSILTLLTLLPAPRLHLLTWHHAANLRALILGTAASLIYSRLVLISSLTMSNLCLHNPVQDSWSAFPISFIAWSLYLWQRGVHKLIFFFFQIGCKNDFSGVMSRDCLFFQSCLDHTVKQLTSAANWSIYKHCFLTFWFSIRLLIKLIFFFFVFDWEHLFFSLHLKWLVSWKCSTKDSQLLN